MPLEVMSAQKFCGLLSTAHDTTFPIRKLQQEESNSVLSVDF